jgi:hypothetical protein
MPIANGSRHLTTPDNRAVLKQWRRGRFIVLSCAALIALAAFAQQPPSKNSTRRTEPLPGINVP